VPLLEGHVFAQLALVFALIGLIGVLMRWTFRRDAPAQAAAPTEDFGLLVVAAQTHSAAEAARIRTALAQAQIRSTTARRADGSHVVLVFPSELDQARRVTDGPDLTLN
jgi:hypothetical protein